MADKRESSRVKDQKRVLDAAARQRRMNQFIQRLEMDNHHEDPHEHIDTHANVPNWDDKPKGKGRKSKPKLKSEPFKQTRLKNFAALLEEDSFNWVPNKANYLSARVPPSKYPPRHFCAVCGFESNYTCPQCGTRYCCIKCMQIHQETRCLKWFG